MISMRGKLVLFAIGCTKAYAKRVAYEITTFPDFYGNGDTSKIFEELQVIEFADGEIEVEILSSIRGKDVFLIASAGRNTNPYIVQRNKMELYHAIDALRRAQAARITLFEPYCTCSRSDRTTRRNSVGFWIHYKTLAALGVDHIITYQLHSEKSRTVVDPSHCAIDDIPADSLLMEYMTNTFIRNIDFLNTDVKKNWIFCSVDIGGENVVRKYARIFDTQLISAYKQRNYDKANSVEKTHLLTNTDLRGKDVWIVDDMIDTSGSVYSLVKALKKKKVNTVNIAITHAVFSPPAITRLRELKKKNMLDRVIVTDTLEFSDKLQQELPFLHVISSARLSAEIIMRLHEEASLSPFFADFDPWSCLTNMRLFL